MYALSPFRSDREGPSSKILKGKARTLAASLSAWLAAFFYCKAPIWNACESWARLTSFSPAHVQWTASRSRKETLSVHRNQYRIRSTETNIAFGPKTKSCRRARQLFFSQSLFLIAFLVLGGGREGRPFVVCEGQADTQTQKPAVISVCIRLMLGGGDWKPSLFKWEIQHLLKSMGFDAGSRLGGGDWKPSLFKWEIQHLLKSMGFDAGSGLGGVDEQLPPGWALINPAESHQRCWAEIHDPPGMPIFYGWRHGVGRKSITAWCLPTSTVVSTTPFITHDTSLHDSLDSLKGELNPEMKLSQSIELFVTKRLPPIRSLSDVWFSSCASWKSAATPPQFGRDTPFWRHWHSDCTAISPLYKLIWPLHVWIRGNWPESVSTLLKNGAFVRSLGDTGTKMALSLCWDFKLSNEGSFVKIGQEMTKLGWKVWKKSLQSLRAELQSLRAESIAVCMQRWSFRRRSLSSETSFDWSEMKVCALPGVSPHPAVRTWPGFQIKWTQPDFSWFFMRTIPAAENRGVDQEEIGKRWFSELFEKSQHFQAASFQQAFVGPFYASNDGFWKL